jgi:hypothetical protein
MRVKFTRNKNAKLLATVSAGKFGSARELTTWVAAVKHLLGTLYSLTCDY